MNTVVSGEPFKQMGEGKKKSPIGYELGVAIFIMTYGHFFVD